MQDPVDVFARNTIPLIASTIGLRILIPAVVSAPYKPARQVKSSIRLFVDAFVLMWNAQRVSFKIQRHVSVFAMNDFSPPADRLK